MDHIRTAAVLWPFPITLACALILKNERLEPIMQTAIWCLIAFAFAVVVFALVSQRFSDPPDQIHPD